MELNALGLTEVSQLMTEMFGDTKNITENRARQADFRMKMSKVSSVYG